MWTVIDIKKISLFIASRHSYEQIANNDSTNIIISPPRHKKALFSFLLPLHSNLYDWWLNRKASDTNFNLTHSSIRFRIRRLLFFLLFCLIYRYSISSIEITSDIIMYALTPTSTYIQKFLHRICLIAKKHILLMFFFFFSSHCAAFYTRLFAYGNTHTHTLNGVH